MEHATRNGATQRVVVVGAGGNIGSHVVPHLARMPEVGQLVLIDGDRYEPHNVANQAITAAAIGRQKATVQAHIARRINPELDVRAIAERVEAVPLGLLRADCILACLDSRRSRQSVNQAATRLGVPWIDAGVLADGLLARVDIYPTGRDLPCLECGWDAHDYAALEQTYPCTNSNAPAPSSTPSGLGALAASLQALECMRQLRNGSATPLGAAEQVVIGVLDRRHYHTARPRNPACRLGHARWTIEPLTLDAATATLHSLFDGVSQRTGSRADAIAIDTRSFVRRITCTGCGTTRGTLRTATAPGGVTGTCRRCGGVLVATGAAATERLCAADLTAADLRRSVRSIGIRAHEIITVAAAAAERHFELIERNAARSRAPRVRHGAP